MSRIGPTRGFGRKVSTAGKEHSCFAVCGATISKGESYIADTLTETVGFGLNSTRTLMTLAWHMKCAPLTKAAGKQSAEDAIKEKAKHPTRLGVQADA